MFKVTQSQDGTCQWRYVDGQGRELAVSPAPFDTATEAVQSAIDFKNELRDITDIYLNDDLVLQVQ